MQVKALMRFTLIHLMLLWYRFVRS